MKTQTQVVVIGGGIAGCSTLYHLTQEGIVDCVLIERDELTSGTTWHSAAQVTNFGPNQTMIGLKTHSINLYKELADDPDYPINYHHGTGGLRLASTQDHLDGYNHFKSMAHGMGVEFEILDPEECKRRHPLISTDNLLGALWDPLDGDIDPAQLCQALARRARKAGAEVYRFTPVTDLTQKADDSWIVHTEKGDIACEHVVNAGGYRCNEVGSMMGVEHPVASMEHQYMLTDTIAEIEELGDDFRAPLIRCPTADFYQRAEKKGLLIGFYEQGCKTWGMGGIDPNFTSALCPDDLDRVIDVMEGAFHRLPCLETAGIHTIINGPITYTPDGLPLVGKIPGKRNAYCITGLRAGLGEGGGHGWLLAQIIAHGEACYDTWCIDPRRFTKYANVEYTALKAIEDYQNEFRFHMPHEFRPAGRLAKTTPITPILADEGACFGVVNGWERALFFKPSPGFVEEHSFHFTPTKDVVAKEIDCVQTKVGIMEVSGFNRYEISGDGASEWLESLFCGRIPKKTGKVGLGYFLTERGNVLGEATLAKLDDSRYWWGSAAAAENHDWDWLMARKPDNINIEALTNSHQILVVAGPLSRDLLSTVAPYTDWSKQSFPWLSVKSVRIGHVEATAMSVSFSGELAWELHIPAEQLALAYKTLTEAGEAFGLGRFGLYATESMRIEKGYRHWKADLIDERNPMESALDRFVKRDKPDFPGKAGLEKQLAKAMQKKFVSMVLDTEDAPAHPGDSIYIGDNVVGVITSAAYGHRTQENLAMGFVDAGCVDIDTKLEVSMLGQRVTSRVVDFCRYDPENEKVRG
ncbi:MAG: FAD-dependent oxidoreductase [Rhodospirillales bacterium]|jgi:dimethylglycine dehydrogenase|nr:FAD-dependent oxidoreductase [Rhodospirillales bacterium]MBT4039809.1 FAD-dependent oxidoreductase [Rhodospirillales bacterium]MBT4627559.1 FAD-dependent oxidoreductase [Rhodospirillales bacterium]MBT5521675.1 FAD-dependent oxidoreductase [Rhodospirillales bacterium]MBT6110557.1 FAD-dependent oxidoreductase [Rhodospirillales bacterium]